MIHRLPRGGVRAACLAALLTVLGAQPARAALPILGKLDAALRDVVENPLASLSRARVIVSAKPGQFGSLLLTLRPGGFTILTEHPSMIGRSDGEHFVWGDTTFTEKTVAWGSLAATKVKPANTLGGTGALP